MPMRIKLPYLLVAFAIFLMTAQVCQAQDAIKKKRLRSPATTRGFIGGESQDHYVIRARKGQTLTVSISWKKEDDNTASFSVSPDSDANSEPLAGKETDKGKRWTGKVPKTGDYLISVVAHPSAHYKLRVTVK
jgi:hypothetical protein